jgi:hypothetical protein
MRTTSKQPKNALAKLDSHVTKIICDFAKDTKLLQEVEQKRELLIQKKIPLPSVT